MWNQASRDLGPRQPSGLQGGRAGPLRGSAGSTARLGRPHADSVGTAVAATELRPDGPDAASGTGELLVRGPS
jgi:hypothetical protein